MNDAIDNPYAPSNAQLEEEIIELELAGRGARLIAVILNSLIIMLTQIPTYFAMATEPDLLPAIIGILSAADIVGGIRLIFESMGFLLMTSIVAWLGIIVYNLVLFHRQGQTLGKRIMGIKVIRSNGDRCSLRRFVFLRYALVALLGGIPFIGIFVSIADPLLIFRESRQCLHDTIADTIVIKV